MSPKNRILQMIKTIGIDEARIASTELPERYQARFEAWLDHGYHADMAYMQKRQDGNITLDRLLPGCRSIIVLAANYHVPDETMSSGRAVVSRYARTRDYHKILGSKTKKIIAFLEEQFQAQARAFVDVGPVLERAFAEQAGLGFIGKSSMLITKDYGTWVFLAVILTDLDLEPDSRPADVSCASCTRCIQACPTKAIVGPGMVDSRRCISYLTIENRGTIPEEFRHAMGNRIFGCDACQDACPHNRRAQHHQLPDFADRKVSDTGLDLQKILSIETDEQFCERFAGTPIMRAKRLGLLRNACVVAGNQGDRSLCPTLTALLQRESDAMLKEHAQWALDQLS